MGNKNTEWTTDDCAAIGKLMLQRVNHVVQAVAAYLEAGKAQGDEEQTLRLQFAHDLISAMKLNTPEFKAALAADSKLRAALN